jgi:hypothetical protein
VANFRSLVSRGTRNLPRIKWHIERAADVLPVAGGVAMPRGLLGIRSRRFVELSLSGFSRHAEPESSDTSNVRPTSDTRRCRVHEEEEVHDRRGVGASRPVVIDVPVATRKQEPRPGGW